VSRDRQRVVVSIGTAACLLFATVASTLVGSPREAPAYALSSSVVFYLERFRVTLAASYLVLVVVVRGLIYGELPTRISREAGRRSHRPRRLLHSRARSWRRKRRARSSSPSSPRRERQRIAYGKERPDLR